MPKSHIQNYLLFDASAIIHFFYEKEKYAPVLDYLLRRKEGNQSFFYIPCFCIAEVKNTFAKLRHRLKLISQEKYDEMLNVFTEDWIHDRKFLYPYYLNRYHNLNTDDIVKIEHTTKTEYHIKDAKDDYKFKLHDDPTTQEKRTENEEVRRAVLGHLRDSGINTSKFYLNGLDILIIAMGRELARIHEQGRVFIITKDKRLAEICNAGFGIGCPRAIYIERDKLPDIKELFSKK